MKRCLSVIMVMVTILIFSACEKRHQTILFSASFSQLYMEASGGELIVEIESNQQWTASCDQNWVSVSPTSGNGNGTVVCVVQPNTKEEADNFTLSFALGKGFSPLLTYTYTVPRRGVETK